MNINSDHIIIPEKDTNLDSLVKKDPTEIP